MITRALLYTIIALVILILFGYTVDVISYKIGNIIAKTLGNKISYLIMNRLTFIGVIHHELSHALLLFLTGAKIIKVNLFKPQGNTLGNVKFIPRGNKLLQSVQLSLSAIAPVILGMASVYSIYLLLKTYTFDRHITGLIYYIQFSILVHSSMSMQDIKNALKGSVVCILITFCIIYMILISS